MGLSIGSLTLSPSFSPAIEDYTANTSNATNTVTATPKDPNAQVTVDLQGTAIANGSAALWQEGENVLTVTVTNGGVSKLYAVTVMKE